MKNKLILTNSILEESDACFDGKIWLIALMKKYRKSWLSFYATYKKAPDHYKAWALHKIAPEYTEWILSHEISERIAELLTTKLVPSSSNSGRALNNIMCSHSSEEPITNIIKDYIVKQGWLIIYIPNYGYNLKMNKE